MSVRAMPLACSLQGSSPVIVLLVSLQPNKHGSITNIRDITLYGQCQYPRMQDGSRDVKM